MINWTGADWTLQMFKELKLLSAAFVCWQECSLRQIVLLLLFPSLPALCIMIILVYFLPRKVRRSLLPWLNALSHSPGAEQIANRGKS